jgi:hypothetical protein
MDSIKETSMHVPIKRTVMAMVLSVLQPGGAMAQGAPTPAPSTHPLPSAGLEGWISGHPGLDTLVAVIIIALIAGSYLMRRRSRV